MRISTCAALTRALVALGALLTATSVHAQAQNLGRNLNVMAVNANNGAIYSVTFAPPGGSTSVGNSDGSSYLLPTALAFVTNASTNQLDLLVADSVRGAIYRYAGALAPQTPPNPATRTLVWNAWSAGTGPRVPDALAVDGYGNLFVGNSLSLVSGAQLWEFPAATSGSGSFAPPVLLDKNFQVLETVLEVVLAPTDLAGANGVAGGDLIVLTSARVLAYSKASGYTSRITLFTFPHGCPDPDGMDFWPIGNGAGANYSLLISNHESRTISRYYFTNPLTAAPAPFATGLGELYRVKTLFQAGNPLVVASEEGAILEFGGNPDGTGSLLATVTQSVTYPRGLAVSNSFTNAASVCLQPGGCNLTGLLTHTVTGVSTLAGDIVENVCTVNADPRVTIVGGVWSCSVPYTPPSGFTCPAGTPANGPGCLPVNAFCPGFDDTGNMVIPDTLCGKSGSSGAGFSLIKTLVQEGQLWVPSGNGKAGGYVQHELVNADGTGPICGPGAAADGAVIWGPLLAEGTDVGSPNMRDISSGCGSGRGGTSGFSVFGEGFSVNEAAPELNPIGGLLHPLENSAQSKYNDLATTIDNLTQRDPNNPKHTRWTDNNPNIAQSVSLELWGGNVPPANNVDPFGCLDQSWLDFYNATKVDTDGSPQYIADLQNAANLLTNADVTGNTTCAGIIDYSQLNTPNAFVQTPQSPNAPSVMNPYGQLVSPVANLYYTINTRLLGNPYSGVWPLPLSVNVVPTSVTLASSASPGSAALSWNTNGDSGCTLSSSDNTYQNSPLSSPQQLNIPPGDAGTIVTYTVNCSSGPPASTVMAYVNVYPPPTLTVSVPAIALNGMATLTWNTNHAQGCTASTTDPTPADAFSGPISGANSKPLSPTTSGSWTYTMTCTTPAVVVQANLSVVAAPTLSVSSATIVQGAGATLTWNSNGSSGCSWISNDPAISGKPATTSPTAVNPASAGVYNYTLNCTTPINTASLPVQLTVTPQPANIAIQLSAYKDADNDYDVVGDRARLSWTLSGGTSGCQLIGTWPAKSVPQFLSPFAVAASGSMLVTFKAVGTYTYTLSCTNPGAPVQTGVVVNAHE
jgi:hypothetical protein